MKKCLVKMLSGIILVGSLVGCSDAMDNVASAVANEMGQNDTLVLDVAHNQTSLEGPYAVGMLAFEKALETISGGQIEVNVHHGTLGINEADLITKLQNNEVDIIVAAPGWVSELQVPELEVLSLYYLFDSFDHWETCLDGDFGDYLKTVVTKRTKNEFKILDYWSAAVRDVYAKVPVYSPDDLSELSIRITSSVVQEDYFEAMNATPVVIAWGDLYNALATDKVDAAENDYTNIMLEKHHTTQNGKYISETHHDYTTRLVVMNGEFYDSLTSEQQSWVDEAINVATTIQRQATYDMIASSKAQVIAEGAIVIEHNEINIDAFKKIAMQLQDEFAVSNNMTSYLEMIRQN